MKKDESLTIEEKEVLSNHIPKSDLTENKPKKLKIYKRKDSEINNLMKRDMAFLQKKLAELEIAISGVQENVQKIDISGLEELKQKVEDVEDLAMVENAGIIELKKMLEAMPVQQLEERLTSLEQKATNIAIPDTEEIKNSVLSSMSDTGSQVNQLGMDIDKLKTQLNDKLIFFEKEFSRMGNSLAMLPDLNTLKSDMKSEVLSSMPDYNLIRSDVQSVIQTFKSGFEKEKEGVESKFNRLYEQINKSSPENLAEEIKQTRNESLVTTAKVEAIEKYIEDFKTRMGQLKSMANRVDVFKSLYEEVTSRLESFKEYQTHVEDAVKKNEDIERRIQRDMNKVKENSEDILKSQQLLSDIKRDVDRHHEIQPKVASMEDKIMNLDNRFKSVEEKLAVVQDIVSLLQNNLFTLEEILSKLDLSKISSLQKDIKNVKGI